MSHLPRLRCRELGLNCRHGTGARLQSAQSLPQSNWSTGFVKTLAKSSGYLGTWKETNDMRTGAIYGVEFSRDGKWLVSCCSRKGILLMDPFNMKPIIFKDDAHGDCVNCATIIDDYQFATGSDDHTIKIWDVRKLSNAVSQVDGFSNWVKSVQRYQEYVIGCSFNELLAYNMYTGESAPIYDVGCLTRVTVAPKTNKLVMSSQAACIMVVHDLDINCMRSDLHDFRPSDYMGVHRWLRPNPHHPAFAQSFCLDHSRRRNRVEIINDFRLDDGPPEMSSAFQPPGGQRTLPNFITALIMHPEELCVVSRNVLLMNRGVGQYTSVHDISESNAPCQEADVDTVCYLSYPDTEDQEKDGSNDDEDITDSESEDEEFDNEDDREPDENHNLSRDWLPEHVNQDNMGFSMKFPLHELEANQLLSEDVRREVRRHCERQAGRQRSTIFVFEKRRAGGGDERADHRGTRPLPLIRCIPKSLQRLMFHTVEAPDPNMKYIKEPGFDPTGRFIASPYGDGIRLLGFDQHASSLDEIGAGEPHSLYQLNMEPLTSQDSALVSSCKISPQGSLVVASTYGERINVDVIEGGSLNFFQPRL